MNDDDRDLRELFAQLKREDRDRILSFQTPAARAAPRWRPVARVAAAAAIALIVLVLAQPDRTPPTMARHVVDL
jgi:negative regulator of sigma E activity